jgi:hypothetical protein
VGCDTVEKLEVTRYKSNHFPPSALTIDEEFCKEYDRCQKLMKEKHLWFEDGHNYQFRQAINRKIILGRYQFYVQFADFMYEKTGTRYYLLDFMFRPENVSGCDSLLYFILDAEEIHVNLEGVSPRLLWQATVGIGKLSRAKEGIKATFTTAWEINQLYFRNLLDISWFHTGSSMTRRQAYRAMGKEVPMNRILNDNRRLLKEFTKENSRLEVLEEL